MKGTIMDTLFRTKNKLWQDVQSNLLFIGVVELLIYNVGLSIKYKVQALANPFVPIVGEQFGIYYNSNFWIIIPILLTLLFMYLTCPGALRIFTDGTLGQKLTSLGKGLLLGALFLGLETALVALSGTATFSFNQFSFWLIPVIIPLFIQCSAEEILLRGYVLSVVGEKHSWDTVCFVSGTLFIFHHIVNMEYYGFNAMFCLNVFLLGVAFCLFVWDEGNFWIVCGIHTAWNYVQSYLFSTSINSDPNSIGMFLGQVSGGNAFYEATYGYEGALTTTVLMVVLIAVLVYRLHKKGQLKDTMSIFPAEETAGEA